MRGDALLHTNAILRQSCSDVQAIADSLRAHLRSKVATYTVLEIIYLYQSINSSAQKKCLTKLNSIKLFHKHL